LLSLPRTARSLSRDDALSQCSLFREDPCQIPVALHLAVQCAAIQHHRLPTGPRPSCQSPDEQNKSKLHVSFLQKHRLCEGPTGATHLLPISRAPRHVLGAIRPRPQSVTPFSSSSKLHSASSGTSPRQLATPNRTATLFSPHGWSTSPL
jgi:hypothetical protein